MYAVRSQEGGFPWRRDLVTRWKHEWSFQDAGNVLFLNQVLVTRVGGCLVCEKLLNCCL